MRGNVVHADDGGRPLRRMKYNVRRSFCRLKVRGDDVPRAAHGRKTARKKVFGYDRNAAVDKGGAVAAEPLRFGGQKRVAVRIIGDLSVSPPDQILRERVHSAEIIGGHEGRADTRNGKIQKGEGDLM